MIVYERDSQSESILGKALLSLKKWFGAEEEKVVIDLQSSNQSVKEFREGFMPLFLTKKSHQLITNQRKQLLKKRYYQILKAEEGQKNQPIGRQNKERIKIKLNRTSDTTDSPEGQLRELNRIILSENKIKIFEIYEKGAEEREKYFQSAVYDTVKKSEKVSKADEKLGQEKTTEKKECQNPCNNPFLARSDKKLCLDEVIARYTPAQNKCQTIKFPKLQTQSEKPSQNVEFRQAPNNEPSFMGMNMFGAGQYSPFGNKSTPTDFSQAVALFGPPQQKTEPGLFAEPITERKGPSVKGKKKKGPARVYQ